MVRIGRAVAAVLIAGGLAGCPREPGVVARADLKPAEEEIRPVYPVGGAAPDPLALRLCETLHDLPERRRAECCSGRPGIVLTNECARMLSASVRTAGVRLDAGEIGACAAAMRRTLDGCEWVGIFPTAVPAECASAIHGSLAAGARCRSSLECPAGMRCHGGGPTAAGTCGPPRGEGAACSLAVDTLASHTRQEGVDGAHPECLGYCERHRCMAPLRPEDPCALSSQCGAGRHCASGRCAAGTFAPVGQSCTGGDCGPGARCHQGRCIAPKAAGAACDTEFECRGGCLRGDGGAGRCGMRCGVR